MIHQLPAAVAVDLCFSKDVFLPKAHQSLEGFELFLVQGIVESALMALQHGHELSVQLA